VRWISLGVLAVAGLVLALNWGHVPDRWVIHWDLHGRPDAWATKSIAATVWPLLIGFCVWVSIEVMAVWIRRGGGRGPGALPREALDIQVTVARWIGFGVVTLTAALAAALPVLAPLTPTAVVIAALAVIALVVGGTVIWAMRRTRQLLAAGVVMPEGFNGVIYNNPRDPRLWVPKPVGVGRTINFGHRLAWPVTIAFFVVPLAFFLVVARFAR